MASRLRVTRGERPVQEMPPMTSIMCLAGELPDARRYLTEALPRASGNDLSEPLIRRDLMRVLQQTGDLAAASEHAQPLVEIAARTGDPRLSEMAWRLNAHQERHTRGMTAEMLATAVAVADGSLAV